MEYIKPEISVIEGAYEDIVTLSGDTDSTGTNEKDATNVPNIW